MRSNSQTKPAQQILWQPSPGPQTEFLSSPADEVLYGGAAGGGKSAAILALPLRWIDNPQFSALVLRRDTTQLRDLLVEGEALYSKLGGKLNQTTGTWRFPSGARIWFTHCEHESDVGRFDGQAFNLVCFDELTHFTERQYLAVRARIRGTDPSLPRWTRSTTNPGGPGHEWVFKRFRAWLDPSHTPRARFGWLRWYVRRDAEEIDVPAGTQDTLSRTFIPAKLEDNPHITSDYRAQLMQLDPVRRAQLLLGDWLKKPSPKDYWDRSKITHRTTAPLANEVRARVRCWDLAASADGDWTVGAKGCITRTGTVIIEHIARFRGKPDDVHTRFATIAAEDRKHDPRCEQWIPEDPGQAGKDQVRSFQNENPGIAVRARRPSGDKLTRFRPASARATTGTLEVMQAAWNADLHDELEELPVGKYDDQADAVADLVAILTGDVPATFDGLHDKKNLLPRSRI